MKYSPLNFARAFTDVLRDTPKDGHPALYKRFAMVLENNNALNDAPKILEKIKKIIAREDGISIIKIETARELKNPLILKIKSLFDKASDFSLKTNPELIAGLKITIDDETSIDNSLQRKLKCLK